MKNMCVETFTEKYFEIKGFFPTMYLLTVRLFSFSRVLAHDFFSPVVYVI